MKKIDYLRASLCLPFAVGGLAWVLQNAGISSGWVDFLVLTMVTGGLPLLATVAILLYISYRSTQDAFEQWWLGAPILMALMCGPFIMVISAWAVYQDRTAGADLWGAVGIWFVLGMFSVGVGYLYIGTAMGLYFMLKRAGLIERQSTLRLID